MPAKVKIARLISPAYPVRSTSEMANSDSAIAFPRLITDELDINFCSM